MLQANKMAASRRRLALMISVAALAGASTAVAQEASVDEVVVTARKTAERLQDVPISVNALSGDQLRDRSAVDVKDILRTVPGFSFSNVERGLGNYNIRGVSTVASAPTVGVFLDDISLVTVATGFSGAFDPVFFDMERLEVLKGPQGTLYGGSAMGGAIKYVSAQPRLGQFGGEAAAGVAETTHGAPSYNAEAVLNVPVGETVAVRAGVFYRRDGGFVDNVAGANIRNSNYSSTAAPIYTPQVQPSRSTLSDKDHNSADTYVGRLSVLWSPDDSLSVRASAFYQDYTLDNPGQFFLNLPDLTSSYRLEQPTKDKAGVYNLSVEKDFGAVQFTSLTAYFDRDLNWVRDYSFFVGGLVPPVFNNISRNVSDSRSETFSQEVRLASNAGPEARLRWIAGLYYSDQDDRLVQEVIVRGGAPVLGSEQGYFGDTSTRTKQYSAFGEASFRLTDQLEATAGVRVFKIDQTVDIYGAGPFNGGTTQANGRKSSEDGINPKVGLSYKVQPDNLVYASAAKGFRPGGPNRFQINPTLCAADLARLGITGAPDTFKSDNLWSYELGTKNTFAGGRAMLNGALFYTDWKEIQQQINLTGCGFQFTANAGQARVKGAEVEGRFNITDGFQIGGSSTYTDARITGAAPGTTARDDDRVQATPKWMASAYAAYTANLDSGWRLQIRGEYQYQGNARRLFGATQSVTFLGGVRGLVPNLAEFRDSYEVVNGFVSLSDGATDLRLYMNNALDARPLIDTDLSAGVDRSTTIRPRTVGVEVRRRF